MASDHSNGPPHNIPHGDGLSDYPGSDLGYPVDKNWQNGGSKTPDSLYRLRPTGSGSGASLPPTGWTDEPRKSNERQRSRQRPSRSGSGQTRICKKCGEQLTGQFVRALDGTFHLDCFKCRVTPPPPSQTASPLLPRWIMLTQALLLGLWRDSSLQVFPGR